MKRFIWIMVACIGFSLLLGTQSLFASGKPFKSMWDIFQVPLNVSDKVAILDYGVENCLEFANGEQKSKQWIYAFQSELERDEVSGKFTHHKSAGEERLIRFFNDQQSEIIIDWSKIEKNDGSLEDRFIKMTKSLVDSYASVDQTAKKVDKVMKSTMSGLPAMGVKYTIDDGKEGYVTFWMVRSEKFHRWYIIRFFYAKGFEVPDGAFATFKDKVVFLKP